MSLQTNYATLKKEHLRKYQVIKEPGIYKVKVANSVLPNHLYDEGAKARYLVNLRCTTEEGFETCLGIMGNLEIIPYEKIRSCFMSGVIWENNLDDLEKLPAKGEEVIATFEYVEDTLLCTAITLIPRKELPYFELDNFCKNRKLFLKLLDKQ